MNLSFCGDDCDKYPRYIATENNDIEELNKIAELWYRVGWRDSIVPANEMTCVGCLSVKTCNLNIRECAISKQIENCGKCNEYPCTMVLKAFEKTDNYSRVCREKCSKQEFEQLAKAFF